GRVRRGSVWRRWIHQGLSRGEALSRRQDRHDLRRLVEHAAPDHRSWAAKLRAVAKSKPKPPKPLKKRNIIARDTPPRPGAGPMKEKGKPSRQEEKVAIRKKLDELGQ